jgi:hypothetical protein
MNLLPVNNPGKKLPYKKSSIYKLHSLKRLPNVIVKVGGILFWDDDAWAQEAEKSRSKQIQEAERVRQVG